MLNNKEKTQNKNYFYNLKFVSLFFIIAGLYVSIYFILSNKSIKLFYIEITAKMVIITFLFFLFYFLNIVYYKSFLYKINILNSFKNWKILYFLILIGLSIIIFFLTNSLENILQSYLKINIYLTNNWYLKFKKNNIIINIVFFLFIFPFFIEILFKGMITKSFVVNYNIKKTLILSVILYWNFYLLNDFCLFSNKEYFESIKIIYSLYLDILVIGIISVTFYLNTDEIIYPVFINIFYNLALFLYYYLKLNTLIQNNIIINLIIFISSLCLLILFYLHKFYIFKNSNSIYLIDIVKFDFLKNNILNEGIIIK